MAILLGTLGVDDIRGSTSGDVITAFDGNDTITGKDGADVIDAGAGNDIIYANTRGTWADGDIDTVLAGLGDDRVYAGYGDILNGGFGFDRLSLDLSSSSQGVNVDFRPMTLLDVSDLVTIKIGTTELTGFQTIDEVRGTAGNDRIILGNPVGYGATVDGGAGNDVVRATVSDDHLVGGDGADRLLGRKGLDTLSGGNGDDLLLGGTKQDTLTGGAGADQFVFKDGDSPSSRRHADVVTDFSHADGDKISLRGIDAIAGGDDDRFTFIGDAKFSGTAGELRFSHVGDATFIAGDTNGDGKADFQIMLHGAVDLVRTDFML